MSKQLVIYTGYEKYNKYTSVINSSCSDTNSLNTSFIYDYLIKQYETKDKNILLENLSSFMTLDDFKNMAYTEITTNNTQFNSNLYIWTNDKIVELFKILSKYKIDNCNGLDNFIFIEIKKEYLDYITFDLCNIYTNYDGDKYMKRLTNINPNNKIYVVMYIDIMSYIKDTINKYINHDEIIKHLVKPTEMFKLIENN